MTSKCICWGRAGSGHWGGWKSGASWNPIPEVVSLAEDDREVILLPGDRQPEQFGVERGQGGRVGQSTMTWCRRPITIPWWQGRRLAMGGPRRGPATGGPRRGPATGGPDGQARDGWPAAAGGPLRHPGWG